MTIEEMRKKLRTAPPYANSARWQNKVTAMNSAQVYAIYNDWLKRGYFDKWKRNKKLSKESDFYQMTIFDYFIGEEYDDNHK